MALLIAGKKRKLIMAVVAYTTKNYNKET